MSYNGWKNKETWLVNLWLGDMLVSAQEDGEEVSPEYIASIVDDLVDEAGMRNFLLRDLLNVSLYEIDYGEIAQYYSSGPDWASAPPKEEP